MMMSMVVRIKCNKYPVICKLFENLLEILYIDVLNTVQGVPNEHLGFLKKVCKSQVSR